jgi:hypothetical protein
MTSISPVLAAQAAMPSISSATASNWLKEAQAAIASSESPSGMLGALQNSAHSPGSISSFLNNTASASNAFALIAQNALISGVTATPQLATNTYDHAMAAKRSAALNPPPPVNFTPPQGLDPIIYFDDGSTIDTVNNILTMADGKQIDTTTGLPVINSASLIEMPDGSYLDTDNNVLTLPDGTKIDIITGLNITA